MKCKFKGTLKTEYTTITILLVVCLCSLLVSIFIEFILYVFIKDEICQKLHFEYFNNVMLGIAASAAISYLSLLFPFLHRKNEQISSITNKLDEIYSQYTQIYATILLSSNGENKLDNYSKEYDLLKSCNELNENIVNVKSLYSKSQFTSNDIEKNIKMLKTNLKINLSMIKGFCNYFLLETIASEKINNITNMMTFNDKSFEQICAELDKKHLKEFSLDSYDKKKIKDIISKRSEEDCYKFLLNEIDKTFSFNKIRGFFSFYNVNITNYTVNNLNDILNSVHSLDFNTKEFAYQSLISSGIMKIKDKHLSLHLEERTSIYNQIENIVKKYNINNNEEYRLKIDEIYNAIKNDNFEEANHMIRKFEETLEKMSLLTKIVTIITKHINEKLQ